METWQKNTCQVTLVTHNCFRFQDLISNSPYSLLYNSYDVSSENLVLDQLILCLMISLFIFITCLADIVRRNSILITYGSFEV